MSKIYFGNAIVALRKSKGMSQKSLIKSLGLKDHSWLSGVENGHKLPSFDLIDKICQFFEITRIQFLQKVIDESKRK